MAALHAATSSATEPPNNTTQGDPTTPFASRPQETTYGCTCLPNPAWHALL